MDSIHVTADADSLHARAAQLIKAGRFGAAKPLFAAAQALAPPSPELTLTGARIAMGLGAWDEAMIQLDSGIADAPTHAGLRKCRADVRRRMGDREGAARDAAEAVINDPADPKAKAILGSAMLNLDRTADAIACLAEAMRGDPGDIDTRSTLAVALERAGDADAALRVLTEGIAMAPNSVALRNAALLVCIRLRDFVQAIHLAEDARANGVADACTFGMKGHSLSSLGDHDQAIVAYQEALKLAPEDPYVRHLVVSATAMADPERAPDDYIRTVFDGYADRFESHLISLHYGIPVAIRCILLNHPRVASGLSLGKALDLGCGTGLVALAIGDLPIESFTGVDLSPRMLAHAAAKRLYVELREGDIISDLTRHDDQWPLIVAADVLCYMGALEDLFGLVHARLAPGGWFVFSVERMLPDHLGTMPGNGNWALQRQGRYAHAEHYVYEALCAAGFRLLRMDRPVVRQEAGSDVPGLLLAVERMRDDC
jgi:predicted TPR repeat methyltransferase/thioredoxin-like negative regulator of GroEL